MHFLAFLLLYFSLIYDALAMPAPLFQRASRKGRSFRVQQAKRSEYVAHGPNALRKAYRKFGIAATNYSDVDVDDFEPFGATQITSVASNQKAADSSDQTGAVGATSVHGGVEFVSPVTIGGQDLTLDFDTGSADLYLPPTRWLPYIATKLFN